jgi:hypothetical protein
LHCECLLLTQSGRAALPWIVGDVRYWPKADTPHYSIRPRFWLHGTSPKYLSNLARVGTKYVLRGCGPLVRRYVEFQRNLLSIAKLNSARSHVRCSICSLVWIAQTCFCRKGGLAPISFPLFQGLAYPLAERHWHCFPFSTPRLETRSSLSAAAEAIARLFFRFRWCGNLTGLLQ